MMLLDVPPYNPLDDFLYFYPWVPFVAGVVIIAVVVGIIVLVRRGRRKT